MSRDVRRAARAPPRGHHGEKTQDAVASGHKTPKAQTRRRGKKRKTLWLVLSYVAVLALLAPLPVLLWGWRYVAEQLNRSLICFPLETGLGAPVFASICFDSRADHAFDKKEDRLRGRIDKQMSQLGGLLQLYRDQDRFIFKDSQPESQPPAR